MYAYSFHAVYIIIYLESFRYTKVSQFHIIIRIKQNVTSFDVSVYYSIFVEILHTFYNLCGIFFGTFFIDRASLLYQL